jgi:sterol desaturase/sphingolipid hydroxylase (fatty acid hydroxylase superfamily)
VAAESEMDPSDFILASTRTAILGGVFGALFLLELAFPLREAGRSRAGRFFVNAGMTLLAFAVGWVVVRPLGLGLSAWTTASGLGLLHTAETTFLVKLIAGLLLMDLTFYYWHRANHTIPFLRRFHIVHHIDPDLDVTSAFRFHFGEVFLSAGFRVAQVLVLGIAPLTYLIYEFVFTISTAFHHSNLRIPLAIEKALNAVFVTPRMHGIHHSTVREETDSNYSVILRWWDWLHSSLVLNRPQSAVTIGVQGLREDGDNGFLGLLVRPFRPGRRPGPIGTGGDIRPRELPGAVTTLVE